MGAKIEDELATELMEIFKWSYKQQEADFNRMTSLQNTYDNTILKSAWPTVSQIPLATFWAATEAALGPAMEYLFPHSPFVDVLPPEKMDDDTLDKVRWALHAQMVYRMRLKRACARSVKDSFKLGVGIGIVEPVRETVPTTFDITAGENMAQVMDDGRTVTALRYRYISPGKVIPYPSGVDFNGPDATPVSFFLDMLTEADFRNLFDKEVYGESAAKGDPTKLIDEARAHGFNSQTTIASVIDTLGGRKAMVTGNASADKRIPVMVPVLKCYQRRRHTYIVCSTNPVTIYDSKDYVTRRNPLIKWDAWIDSDRFYPFSQPEALQRVAWSRNVWFNAMYDLMTWSLKRPLVYDSEKLMKPPEFGPRGVIGIPGDVRATARFMDPPGMDNGALAIGQELGAIQAQLTGQRDLTEKNFTRGGTLAFQDLMQSSTGRDRLRHAMLQMTGLENIAYQVLIYMQTLSSGMDLTFRRPAYADGKSMVEFFSITEEDMRHNYELLLDMDSKHGSGAMDAQNKIALYQVKKDNPYFDQWEVARDLCVDEREAQRQVFPRQVVMRKQDERERAELAAKMEGAQQAPAPQNPVIAGAMMGGAE